MARNEYEVLPKLHRHQTLSHSGDGFLSDELQRLRYLEVKPSQLLE